LATEKTEKKAGIWNRKMRDEIQYVCLVIDRRAFSQEISKEIVL